MSNKETQEALGQRLIEEAGGGYLRYRVLKDGSLAILCRLAFTKAIMVGVEEVNPYKRRFCFEDFELAERQFDLLEDELQVPYGFIATRPQGPISPPADEKQWNEDFKWLVKNCPEQAKEVIESPDLPHPMDLLEVLKRVSTNRDMGLGVAQGVQTLCKRRMDEMRIPRNLWMYMYTSVCRSGYART